MARDYGNRRSSRPRNSAPHQLLVVIVTFLLGYLTASVVDIQTISHWMNTQVLAHHEAKPEPVKSTPQHAQVPPKPKFEFYTLLANEKVPGSAQAGSGATVNSKRDAVTKTAASPTNLTSQTQQVSASAIAVAKSNKEKAQPPSAQVVKVAAGKPLMPIQKATRKYVLQVAAFKARQDAEHMKGMLILKGYSVNIVPVSHARGNWFRVVIGPYSNISLAHKAQMDVAKTERLKGMISSVAG